MMRSGKKRIERIQMAHGAGGSRTRELVTSLILPAFSNPVLADLGDSALLDTDAGRLAFTTDGFVVDPLEFPGGDIGKLAVCGTVNDLAVAGARPLALSLALILEEGCDQSLLDRVIQSVAEEARHVGIPVACGDTKVVQHGKGDSIYMVSSGIGLVNKECQLGDRFISSGDRILVSGPLGDHGLCILACRHGLGSHELKSDCGSLYELCASLRGCGATIRVMHDLTRGGLAACCHEMLEGQPLQILLREADLPLRASVRTIASFLGVDPLFAACEGRLLCVVAQQDVSLALDVMKAHDIGQGACEIGSVRERGNSQSPLLLEGLYGVARVIDYLSGDDLPRIC